VIASLVGCSGNAKKVPDLGDLNEMIRRIIANDCSDRNKADEKLDVHDFVCTKLVDDRQCGCHLKIGLGTIPKTPRVNVIELAIGNCNRREGLKEARNLLAGMAPSAMSAMFDDLDHVDGPFHRTYDNVSAEVTWSPDVFQVGDRREPQTTESFRIVLRPKDGKPDTKSKNVEPVVMKPPSCDPRNEDMAVIVTGPVVGTGLKCPIDPPATTLPGFTIDKARVSCDAYNACVHAGACSDSEASLKCSYGTAVTTLVNATAYCHWRRAELPSVAQWQRAIRGPKGDKYPTGEGWLATEGCRKATGKHPRTHEPIRCENTTADGVVYYVMDPDDFEWTRDIDCWTSTEPDDRRPLGVNTAADSLDIGEPRRRPETSMGTFRCTR